MCDEGDDFSDILLIVSKNRCHQKHNCISSDNIADSDERDNEENNCHTDPSDVDISLAGFWMRKSASA